jgi:glycosyltransferase involved in cell wall biosynthesis
VVTDPSNDAGSPAGSVPGSSLPPVSVIVPVYDDAPRLALCLAALARQSYPPDRVEVIVVDNGSDPPADPGAMGYPDVRTVVEPTPGSYAARNAGIGAATADVLAFTDSDCIPAQDWLERGVRRLLGTPDCAVVGGSVPVFPEDPDRPTSAELYDLVTAFPMEHYVRDLHFVGTGNLFTHRRVFRRVGRFDATLQSGGDVEWGQRVWRAGLKQVYDPDVVARHPARRTFAELHRKMTRVTPAGRERARNPIRAAGRVALALIPPVRYFYRLSRSPGLANRLQGMRAMMVAIALHYARALELARLELGRQPRWRPVSVDSSDGPG